ncbi:hypothetical protein Scep_029624 [Stephania cephalantha]|uniref:Ubiquitin-like domain-containing protein n=1 Tax=Stephania cephalantha TaxID=152367 RepID=A0AAP0E5S9_9MAGN
MPCPCQGAALLVPREPAKVLPCSCQGAALLVPRESASLVPKEPARIMPCSCQGAALLMPREPASLVPKEHAKALPCSCQGPCQGATVLPPRNVSRNYADTIKDLKLQIEEKEKIPFRKLKLIYEGKLLKDVNTLAECNIQKESNLQLHVYG